MTLLKTLNWNVMHLGKKFLKKFLSCFDRGPVACNLRQRVVLTSMFNWPRGSHSLLLLGVSFPVVLYSCMV